MDAAAAISWSNPPRQLPSIRGRVCNGAALALSWAMALPAAFLLCRRLAGNLTAPLSAPVLIAVGLIVVATAVAVQMLNQIARRANSTEQRSSFANWLSLVSMPATAAAISLSGSSILGLTILWLAIGSGEIGLWQLRKNRRMHPTLDVLGKASRADTVAPVSHDAAPFDSHSLPFDLQHDASATQKLIYHLTANGAASVEGWLRAQIAADQRTAILHVAFCPAFEQPPTVEAELTDGPAGEVRPTLILPWGIRWELKLDAPATMSTTATVEFIAHEAE